MKYLNERIIANFTGVSSTGLIQYIVYRLVYGNSEIDLDDPDTYDIIFIGNCYKQSSSAVFSIDITDIVRNDVWVPKEDELYNTVGGTAMEDNLVGAYYVYVPSDDALSRQIQVAKVYPYPHYISTMQDNVFFDWISATRSASFPLQGRYSDGGYGKYRLMPRYPYISTDNYRMILVSEVGLNLPSYIAQFRGGLTGSFTVPFSSPSSHTKYTLTNLYSNATPVAVDSVQAILEIAGDYVAQIDGCYSRYYLQWQDRMGGFQSQPFNDKYTYSEAIETETLTDYQGRKRLSNVGVTGKFKINTDWLTEELYPYYESIFTSPVLFLYDTKEDKTYSVILTDKEYTEKTINNQKKLFNLTLNLELNQTQNIIY